MNMRSCSESGFLKEQGSNALGSSLNSQSSCGPSSVSYWRRVTVVVIDKAAPRDFPPASHVLRAFLYLQLQQTTSEYLVLAEFAGGRARC
jgi:hypothetical protein